MITRLGFFRVAALLLLATLNGFAQQQLVGPLYSENVTITSGTSVSTTLDLKSRPIVGVALPSSWTTADITFQVSFDGTTWHDVYSIWGDELIVPAAASRYITFSTYESLGARYIRVRSGTAASAVNQAADRTLRILTRKVSD